MFGPNPSIKPLDQMWWNQTILLSQMYRIRANPQSGSKYKVGLKRNNIEKLSTLKTWEEDRLIRWLMCHSFCSIPHLNHEIIFERGSQPPTPCCGHTSHTCRVPLQLPLQLPFLHCFKSHALRLNLTCLQDGEPIPPCPCWFRNLILRFVFFVQINCQKCNLS